MIKNLVIFTELDLCKFLKNANKKLNLWLCLMKNLKFFKFLILEIIHFKVKNNHLIIRENFHSLI